MLFFSGMWNYRGSCCFSVYTRNKSWCAMLLSAFLLFLAGRTACSPAASFFARAGSPYPISRSRMWLRPKPPRVILQLGISPRLLCPSPKDSRRKGFVLAILFRANFKWWALSCKLSFVTLKWCAIICLLSSFSLCWLLPGVLCVTCIFGRVCAICWTLSFNFPWQIKSLLSRKCLCENEVTHGIMRQYLHSLLIWVNLLVILSQYQINSGPLKC